MRASKCHKCGNVGLREVDGSEVGGMPGVKYQYCPACGWTRAVVKRETAAERRARLKR